MLAVAAVISLFLRVCIGQFTELRPPVL